MIAGITGHQNLGSPDDVLWVRYMLREIVMAKSITYGFTSLAIGADQAFAEVLAEAGIDYTLVLPCSDYEDTFREERDLRRYRALREAAAKIIPLPFEHAEEQAFFEAGKRVVELSEVMLAVWNGLPAKGLGGTADVVGFSLDKDRRVIHVNPVARTVKVLEPAHSQSNL